MLYLMEAELGKSRFENSQQVAETPPIVENVPASFKQPNMGVVSQTEEQFSPPPEQTKWANNPPPKDPEPSETEKWTRFGVGLAHTIGTLTIAAYGGQETAKAVGPVLGDLQQTGLDSAFKKEQENS